MHVDIFHRDVSPALADEGYSMSSREVHIISGSYPRAFLAIVHERRRCIKGAGYVSGWEYHFPDFCRESRERRELLLRGFLVFSWIQVKCRASREWVI
jgi:hypothetical protein